MGWCVLNYSFTFENKVYKRKTIIKEIETLAFKLANRSCSKALMSISMSWMQINMVICMFSYSVFCSKPLRGNIKIKLKPKIFSFLQILLLLQNKLRQRIQYCKTISIIYVKYISCLCTKLFLIIFVENIVYRKIICQILTDFWKYINTIYHDHITLVACLAINANLHMKNILQLHFSEMIFTKWFL